MTHTMHTGMENASEFDNLSGVAAGAYRQNAFYYRMESIFDLEPAEGDPPPAAVAMHAHEYVHFLHNASTAAGQAYLVANLILLRALAAGTDTHGYFLGPEKMNPGKLDDLRSATGIMRAMLGATAPKEMRACTDISNWECGSAERVEGEYAPTIHAVFTAHDASGERKSECLAIGLSFITEGVAYEIEREMRRIGGTKHEKLDEGTRAFPYLAYRLLVRRWTGRTLSARDYIAIGISALHCNFAGYGLSEICRVLRDSTEPVDRILDHVRPQWNGAWATVLNGMQQQQDDLVPGDPIWIAMGEYMKLAKAGALLRRNRWAPEFDFLSEPTTPTGFKKAVGSMLNCLVIQSKPAGKFRMSWDGPDIVGRTSRAIQCLSALQSALHFSQLHIGPDGSTHPTNALAPTPCPFAGGCNVEIADEFPSECKSFPWRRHSVSHPSEKACPYSTGVKALRYASHN